MRTDSGPVIRDNHWHHIIWVFYGDTTVGVGDGVEAFVDGINLGRNVRNTYTRSLKLSNMLLVGAAAPNGVGGFEGRMDEVAIYNLAGLGSQAAVRTKVSLMASNHFLAAYGPPGDAAITITQQPADQTVQKGGTATFTVAVLVFGAPPESLAYQWMRKGSPISGATEASYTTPILSLDDLGTTIYAVRVSTIGGVFVLSREAILTVPVPPQEETYYASQVRQDGAFLYWNFDENGGNALQCAPLGAPPAVTTENDLVPVAGATRVDSTGKLGRAASLNGSNYYQAAALRAGKASLAAPWAVEFWMQVSGPNTDNRADYLLNFGNGGVDNVPAFIYDYEPDTLEVYSNAGRTSNSPLIADTRWHHVLWVFYGDGNAGVANRCNLWVDGAAFGNVRANFSRPITVNERLLVGAATAAGVGGFEGALDELAVYDLSALPNEAAITAKAQSLASHYTAASSADPQPYAEVILAEQPVLYWNFDEADGNARQLAPITLPPFNNSQNELVPFLGATRVEHSLAGSGLFLGNAASFSGLNFFQALDLDTAKATLSAPWAVEFWMQVTGNNSANRADYLMNFGNPDNAPAFIYDFKPDQLEVFGGAGGRSDNGPTLADNNWHHVMWVFYGDGVTGVADRLEAWVDGQNLGNARANYSRPISVNARLIVGAATPGGDNAFEGRLDEIAVYDLGNLATEAEVVTHVQDLVTRHLGAAANPPAVRKLTRSGDEITISWSRTGFVLQENADAANPAGWTDVPGGSASPVVITMPATGNKFYRLRSQ